MGTTNEFQLAFDSLPTREEALPPRFNIGVGILYVVVERKVIDGYSRWGEPAMGWPTGTKFQLIHVMSDVAGGEVRGYFYLPSTGIAYLRSPCYTAAWPAVDEAIARVFGCEVAPYQITSGGLVEYSPRSS